MRPIIGITTDLTERGEGKPDRVDCSIAYSRAVAAAGGVPLLLPPLPEMVGEHVHCCDGFVFTGGDDPRTEPWGIPTHPKAKPIHRDRQQYEVALLDLLRDRRGEAPVLGICLGMQMMALHAGGRLNQHLPDTAPTAADHKGEHAIQPTSTRCPLGLTPGLVWSNHHQAVETPGGLSVTALSPDGVIEAVMSPARPWYCGVQWHPERTADPALGQRLFAALIAAARGRPA